MPNALSIHEVPPGTDPLPESAGKSPASTALTASTSFRDLGRIDLAPAPFHRHHSKVRCSLPAFSIASSRPTSMKRSARVELRAAPVSSLSLDGAEVQVPTSILSAPIALETLASVLRSDRLAWRVIVALKLSSAPGFCGNFASRFPGFDPSKPTPAAQAWLLDRFSRRLHVESVPRTMLVEIRFRSHDAALSAAVVNTLIAAYSEQETESQIQATAQASGWLNAQLADLKTRVDRDQQRLAEFETSTAS